ncbi:MAG: TonB family protein [Mucilaginibacter sp.]
MFDYYTNGKIKSVATSLTATFKLVLDGTRIDYFPNGKRQRTTEFKKGEPIGFITNYYPNGQLYNRLKISRQYYPGFSLYYYDDIYHTYYYQHDVNMVELRDSTGKILIQDGNGHDLVFDDDFKQLVAEGNLKNNKREGEWRGPIADSGRFICVYHKDAIKSGVSYMKSGHHYTFNQIATETVFSDGVNAFDDFIKKNLQYPESAKKRKIEGRVTIGFYVEINGTLSDIKIVKGLFKSLDDEVLRVINSSPLWMPASQFGIPERMYHTVNVYF